MVIGKKVSIIVPVYNVEKYLDRCIESLAEQTYKNTEIILVNDGSTDESLNILNKWREKDSRIIVVNKKNGGLSDARNAGIKIASGDYFCFVDSDDYINRCMIEHLLNLCSAYRVPMAGCGYSVFSEEKIKQPCFDEAKANIEKIDFQGYMQKYMQNETVKMITAWGKIYAKELFDHIEYPVNRIHEDEFTTYKLMYRAKEAVISSMRFMCIFVTVPTAILITTGEEFYSLWVPGQPEKLINILAILTVINSCVTGPMQPLYQIFTITNKVKISSIVMIAYGFSSILITFICLRTTDLGLYAVAGVSLLGSIVVTLCYHLPFAAVYIGLPWYTFFPSILKSVLCLCVVSGVGAVINILFVSGRGGLQKQYLRDL